MSTPRTIRAVGCPLLTVLLLGVACTADLPSGSDGGSGDLDLARFEGLAPSDAFDLAPTDQTVTPNDKAAAGDQAPTGCKTDADCDDGDGCNGEERCDVASGACLPALQWTCPAAPPECNQSGGSPGPTANQVKAVTNTTGFRLRDQNLWTASYATIAAIEAHPSTTAVTLDTVLQNLNRNGNQSATPSVYCLNSWFQWNSGDVGVAYWYPQGITGTASGVPGVGHYNGHYLVLVSWYHKPADDPSTSVNKGVRLSVADITTIASTSYRLVLLVEPTGSAGYKPITIHAGGIAWYKDWLYVADTTGGLRVFDIKRFIEVQTGDSNAIGLVAATNEYHAFNYRYILPQVNRYSPCSGSCCSRFSFLSVDQTSSPPSLISGEYSSGNIYGRLVRWPLDPTTGKPSTVGGAVTSTAAYFPGLAAMQGGTAVGNRIFATSNANTGGYAASLHTGLVGGAVTAYGFPHGIEDLHYSPSSTNMWSLTEFPGQRFVFSVKTSKVLAGCP
jgi:hypothetical protein